MFRFRVGLPKIQLITILTIIFLVSACEQAGTSGGGGRFTACDNCAQTVLGGLYCGGFNTGIPGGCCPDFARFVCTRGNPNVISICLDSATLNQALQGGFCSDWTNCDNFVCS